MFRFGISYFLMLLILNKLSISVSEDPKTAENSLKYIYDNNITVASENVTRYNRHLESEIDNKFHINVDTIIRAGESRALGGKYLNETSFSSNRDCLKWCLETPKCNVVVYEEKNMQSCYMFDCGSPTNFLCKFTSHSFFISSILKVSQHSYELSQWGKQEKHERELASLRNSDISITSSTVSSTDLTVTMTSTLSLGLERSGKPGSKCHHYQFQCLNNSECIAIYNVCDGIPQCPDGSDESVDLKCPKGIADEIPSESPPLPENKVPGQNVRLQLPGPSTTLKSPARKQNSQTENKQKLQDVKEEKQHNLGSKVSWSNRLPDGQMPRSEYYPRIDDSDGLGSPFIHKHSQFVAANDPHVQNLNSWANDYDQYPNHPGSLDQQYPYDSNFQRMDDQYLPNQLSPEYDSGKGYSGYRREDIPYWPNQDIQDGGYPVDELPQAGLHTLSKQNNFPDKESMYAQQLVRTAEQFPEPKHHVMHKPVDIVPPAQQIRPSESEDYKLRRFPLQNQRPYLAYDESFPRPFSNYPDLKSKTFDGSRNVEDNNLYNNDDLIRASIVSQLPMQGEQGHYMHGHEMKHLERTTVSHLSTKETKDASKDDSLIIVKPTPHPKAVQKTVLDFKMSVTELYQSGTVHSREANSAILALVVGLTITFLLFVLLACRVKTLRRRMSRKGRALAHDADYLVNGMYL